VYPADSIFELFTHAGSPVAYALNLGSGAGLWWRDAGFSISANYVSASAVYAYNQKPQLSSVPVFHPAWVWVA